MIAQRLPAHYLELLSDALLKVYWYKNSFRTALRRAGLPDSLLSTWAADESKRDYWGRLMPDLEGSDAGIAVLNRLADTVSEQKTFPDLERTEDSAKRIRSAQKAIGDLKEYRLRQSEKTQELREQKAAREEGRSKREKAQQLQHNLDGLSSRLNQLATKIGTQQAGYDFQKWFYDLMDYFEVHNKQPYTIDGRQIDGSVTIEGTTYLVELKFTLNQSDANDIDSFKNKVLTKADNTHGDHGFHVGL